MKTVTLTQEEINFLKTAIFVAEDKMTDQDKLFSGKIYNKLRNL